MDAISESSPNEKTIVTLPIDSLSLTCGTQIREAINEGTVMRYASQMEIGQKFPPIIAYRDDSGELWIADGHHRIMAAMRCKLTEIRAEIRNGSKADALWAAAGINSENALQLTDNDIHKAIKMLVDAWPDRSNRAIAEVLRCDEKTVRKYRPKKSGTDVSAPEKRIGKDGKSYPAKQRMASKKQIPGQKAETVTSNNGVENDNPVGMSSETVVPMENTSEKLPPELKVTVSSSINLPHDYPEFLVSQLISHFPRDYTRKCPLLILDALCAKDGLETIQPIICEIIEKFADR